MYMYSTTLSLRRRLSWSRGKGFRFYRAYTIPYHTILYYTILYCTILYYTILYHGNHVVRTHVGMFSRTGCTGMLAHVHALHVLGCVFDVREHSRVSCEDVQMRGLHVLVQVHGWRHQKDTAEFTDTVSVNTVSVLPILGLGPTTFIGQGHLSVCHLGGFARAHECLVSEWGVVPQASPQG